MLLVHSAIMVGRRLVSPVPFTRKEILVALLVTLILSWRATAALERAYVIAVQEFVQKSSTSLDKRRADFEKWKELYDNKQLGDEDNLFRAEKLAELESFFDPSRPPLDVEALHESEIDFSKKELLYRIQTLEGLLKRELDRKVTGQHQEALRKGSYKREDASTMEQDKVGSVNQTKSAPRNPVDTSRIPRNESSKSRNKRKKSRSNAMTLFGYSGLFLVSLL